jgi:serine/threonine-protein kinase
MALALLDQGLLDMAYASFQPLALNDGLMHDLYKLAQAYEEQNQTSKAREVYLHMASFSPSFMDIKEKLQPANLFADAVEKGGSLEKLMLGRYQVEKELGRGAMGVVYQGRDPKIGRLVAIKTLALSQEFEGEELREVRERFFREAETAGRLQHQNIVTVFDVGEEHDLAFIAMEYLQGQDLLQYCQPGHLLPISKVLSIVARVADALAFAHRQNVVHRDIKPANIMYNPEEDSVKVTDFGIARITGSHKTKTGLVLGTPSFMSPEQLAGKSIDGRTDLYSLGVMLFQLLTATLPFRASTINELMVKIATEEAPDIRSIRPELPEALAKLVTVSLSKRSEDRFQNGEKFAQELRALMTDLPSGIQQNGMMPDIRI